MKHITGYDEPEGYEEQVPSPHMRKWELRLHAQGPGFVRLEVLLDEAPIGMLRVPDMTHVQWLRERIQQNV